METKYIKYFKYLYDLNGGEHFEVLIGDNKTELRHLSNRCFYVTKIHNYIRVDDNME